MFFRTSRPFLSIILAFFLCLPEKGHFVLEFAHCWASIKNRLRKHLQTHDRDLFKAAEITFQQIIP
jgi:hypothetical protein